jgi:hypothetical protein
LPGTGYAKGGYLCPGEEAFATEPLLQVIAWLVWLVLVIGWFADDSGSLCQRWRCRSRRRW